MQPISLAQLNQRYQQLRAQVQANQINQDQFIQSVHQLQATDEAGNWWTIDPHTGGYLKYSGSDWESADPPAAPSKTGFSAQRQPAQLADDLPGPLKGRSCCLTSPLMVGVMSFGAAGFWFLYSSVRAMNWSSFTKYEGFDILTPLMMGGLPFGLRAFQRPIDKLLRPIYAITSSIPYPIRTGAALGIPVVLGLLTSSVTTYGNGALRFTMLVSIVSGYILTRRMG